MAASKRTHLGVSAYDGLLDRNTPDRLALLSELRTAMPNEELILRCQSQINLGWTRRGGGHARRWLHPRPGRRRPDLSVPLDGARSAVG